MPGGGYGGPGGGGGGGGGGDWGGWGGVASGLGSLGGAYMNWQAMKESNAQNREMFDIGLAFNERMINSARDYNTMMANTAHQREMADLKAAGINPMMTAMGGNGAPAPTSPTTSAPTGHPVQPNNAIGNAFSSAVGSALGAAKTVADIRNADRDTVLKEGQAIATAAMANQQTASAAKLQEETTQMARARRAAGAEADARENRARLDQNYEATERVLGMVKQGSGITNDASSAISNMLPTKALEKGIGKIIQGSMPKPAPTVTPSQASKIAEGMSRRARGLQ